MGIIKCKMCGGDIQLSSDKTYGVCEYCGSVMTLPKVEEEQVLAAFNRGNYFRRIGEFDKALAVYEQIVQEDETNAEAHWCCALCRYGIEYVEDPESYEWVPTCHRASFDHFLEDIDYLAAVQYSDGITRRQYQKEAMSIADVQRRILATSQSEESYIFAALNSARVMVVGTSPENLNSVWVKNEWSRFYSMMKKDRDKLLLPCYRNMDPYDLPESLSILQSYDMGKIGFIIAKKYWFYVTKSRKNKKETGNI